MKNLLTNIEKISEDEQFKVMQFKGEETNYIISNYGRVFNRNTYRLKSKIIKPSGSINTVFRFKNKNVACLTSKLVINNFIKQIDFDDNYLRVVYLDEDKNNLKYDNLNIINTPVKSIYPEKQIIHACELLSQGNKSIKTISLITNLPYYIVYSLFIGTLRKNITKDYEFNCYTPQDEPDNNEDGYITFLSPEMLVASDEKFKIIDFKKEHTNYVISNYGRVFNRMRHRELKPQWINKNEGWYVSLYYKCRKYMFSLAKLVVCNFNKEFDLFDKYIRVIHIDKNRNNLKYNNLKIIVSRSPVYYTNEQIRHVCELLEEGKTNKEINKITEVSTVTIRKVRMRQRWKKISKDYNF